MKALRAAFLWGKGRGFKENLAIKTMKKIHKNNGGAEAWSISEKQDFLKKHGPGTRQRPWTPLSLNVLPRIGDVPIRGRSHLTEKDGTNMIALLPGKKRSAFVDVPPLQHFLEEIELHPLHTTFMTTATGKSFASSELMRNRIQNWTAQAGLPKRRTQHGIRTGAAELLGLTGAIQCEIMSLMSHTQAKTSEE